MSSDVAVDSRPEASISRPADSGPNGTLDLSPVLILLSVGLIMGVILHRQQIRYSPNDASRWNTIYYLVEHGTYQFVPGVDVKWAVKTGQPRYAVWDTPILWTIDMIMVDGKLYSSKPPLLPTVLAGVAWVTQKVSGETFHDNPWVIARTILIVAQVIPFAVMLVLLRRHIFRMTDLPFTRNFAMAAVCFATFLTPWLITLNNHVIAAATGMIALDAAIRIWYEGRWEWYWFAVAGFFAAFTAAIELPAGLLAAALLIALLIKDYRRTLTAGLLAAAIPTAAGLYTNYIVTGQLTPAYESWKESGGFYDYPGSYWRHPDGVDALAEPKYIYLTNMVVGHDGFFSLTPILLVGLAGLIAELYRRGDRMLLAGAVLVITGAVTAVYTVKTNNYGGGCQGFRWLFWVIPMWLLFLPSGIDWLRRIAAGRLLLYAFLAISVFSVGYALDNPWSGNWIRLLMQKAELIKY